MDTDVGDDVNSGKRGQYMVLSHCFCIIVVLGRADTIIRGDDMCFLYDGETTNFLEAIVRSSKGFQYRRGLSDGKAQIRRSTDGWSWRRRMVWWPTIIFNSL